MSIDLHTLSGAYALDALSEEERAEFERHLDLCAACRDEVRELRDAAARMGAGMAARPSTALKSRVLAAAAQQPQLRPRVVQIQAARSRRLVPRLLAAAAAIVVVAGGATLLAQRDSGSSDRPVAGPSARPSATESVSQVFGASDARTVSKVTSNGGRIRLATSAQDGRLAVDTRGLPKLDRRVYQMWALRNGQSTSVGVVTRLADGKVLPLPSAGTMVAITIEPRGGSEQPTTKPIITVDPAFV